MKFANYQGTKSVLNRGAQIDRPCAVPVVDLSLSMPEVSFLTPLLSVDSSVYYLSLLMLANGLRISEALSIDLRNSVGFKKVLVRGLKGSEDRIIDLSIIDAFVSSWGSVPGPLFAHLDRYYVYRCFKKCGIEFKSISSSKYSVTHSLRHLHVQGLRSNNISEVIISNEIGHKNVKNTEKYGRGSKKVSSH